jgi:transglutaminase-like putative cysteine protease
MLERQQIREKVMKIRIGYEIKYHFPRATPMLALLHTYPNRYHMIEKEKLIVEPYTPNESYIDNFGNCCTRLFAPAGLFVLKNEAVVEVDGTPDRMDLEAQECPVIDLPPEVLQFLYPSRYCEVDRLDNFAWQQFGHLPPGYERAQAVCHWVHHHIEFGYNYARVTKTAFEVLKERQGVCRDFAHLAITLFRSLGIPARYVTGYLGDIGVPKEAVPMDFSAWVEVYLSNEWYTFDPRHNQRRIGRIVIAYGRDAADVAITTTFGAHQLEHFFVRTDEIIDYAQAKI